MRALKRTRHINKPLLFSFHKNKNCTHTRIYLKKRRLNITAISISISAAAAVSAAAAAAKVGDDLAHAAVHKTVPLQRSVGWRENDRRNERKNETDTVFTR